MVGLHIVRLHGGKQQQGDGEIAPLSIQLWLDEKGTTVPRSATFGALGSLRAEAHTIIPFVFFTDGTIDCGTHLDAGARYGRTNFYERRVVIDEHVTIDWDDDGPVTYKVLSISPVAL